MSQTAARSKQVVVTGDKEFSFYSGVRFRRRVGQIIIRPTLLNKVVWRLANRYPSAYEQRFAWLFPAWFLYFELEVVKETLRPAGAPAGS